MAKKTKAQLTAELHKLDTGAACKTFRRNLRINDQKVGMNQQDFWGRVGVTQSGGSRYESGRDIPESTQALLALVYCDALLLGDVLHLLRSGTWDFNSNRNKVDGRL